jgi:hypothetical protein
MKKTRANTQVRPYSQGEHAGSLKDVMFCRGIPACLPHHFKKSDFLIELFTKFFQKTWFLKQ